MNIEIDKRNDSGCDLAIAYRIYPKVSKVPPVFSDDKYKLSELCLTSFKQALGNLKVKIWAILDNCPEEYDLLFKKYFSPEELIIVHKKGVGNAATFDEQMNLLLTQNYSEKIYFAEDDYFYLENAFSEMLDFLKTGNADFITPYDHLDYYTHKLHKYGSNILFSGRRHWRSGATTCMTFLTTRKILKRTLPVFRTYTKSNYDTSLWLALTKIRISNPFFNLKMLASGSWMRKIILKAWFHTPLQLLTGRRYRLFLPVPTLSTHMDSKCLAPGIDWKQQFERLIEK